MTNIKIPIWFWIVAVIALLWNLAGLSQFFMDVSMTSEQLSTLTLEEQELYKQRPLWALIGFAIATLGGTLGAIFLLLKKSWCHPLFLISLIGLILQNVWSFFMSDAMEVYGSMAAIMSSVVIIFALFLLWFAKFSIKKGWVR